MTGVVIPSRRHDDLRPDRGAAAAPGRWRMFVVRWAIRARSAVYAFRESLFLLPALIVVAGGVAAEVAAAVDRTHPFGAAVPLTLSMSTNAAIWLLSVVAGATITTAGVVFSLTVVSLQLASSQFSPRVMRSFIRDRLSQCVVGLLVATFVYCVLVLSKLNGEPTDPAPPVSMTAAVALTLGTVLLIIAHLNHLAHRLQVGEVVRAIAREGQEVTELVLTRSASETRADTDAAGPPAEDCLVVTARKDGWVTQAASADLLAAVPPHTTVRLETRTGAYIHAGETLASVWPAPSRPAATVRHLRAVVEVSRVRTMQEDIDFAIRQLVDIGLRALSAAINDPNTAVEVLLRLGSLMRRLLGSELPPETVADAHGRILLRPWELDHAEYIDHAFDQLRQFSPSQLQVAAALLRTLRMLVHYTEEAGHPEHVPALRQQMSMLLETLDATPGMHPADLEHLRSLSSDATDPADHTRRRRADPPARGDDGLNRCARPGRAVGRRPVTPRGRRRRGGTSAPR